jgi:hypothetical protein
VDYCLGDARRFVEMTLDEGTVETNYTKPYRDPAQNIGSSSLTLRRLSRRH